MAEHGRIEIFEILQPVDQDGFEDIRIQGLIVVDGDVPEAGHLFHLRSCFTIDDACILHQGEAFPRPFRKAEFFRCNNMGGKVECGLDPTLQVEQKDVLGVDIVEALRGKRRYGAYPAQASLDGGDFRQDYVPVRHRFSSSARPPR